MERRKRGTFGSADDRVDVAPAEQQQHIVGRSSTPRCAATPSILRGTRIVGEAGKRWKILLKFFSPSSIMLLQPGGDTALPDRDPLLFYDTDVVQCRLDAPGSHAACQTTLCTMLHL